MCATDVKCKAGELAVNHTHTHTHSQRQQTVSAVRECVSWCPISPRTHWIFPPQAFSRPSHRVEPSIKVIPKLGAGGVGVRVGVPLLLSKPGNG